MIQLERAAIIFVHGITGGRSTWENPESKAYMPGMLATIPKIYDGADIYRVDYEGDWSSGPAVGQIRDQINELLDAKISQKKYSKVIFVAHSMGGIFVRTYLMHLKLRWGHVALGRVRLVVSLGTPYEGSTLANYAQFFTFNAQVRSLRSVDVNDFQELINTSMLKIEEKHAGCRSLFTFTGYERLAEPKIGKIVVTERSATRPAISSRDTRGFDVSHTGLSKPYDSNDKIFRWTSDLIQRCLENDGSVCPEEVGSLACKTGDFP